MERTAGSIEVLSPEDVLGIGRGSDVLVVDDDAGNRIAYEAALAPLGRAIVLAGSGEQALARLLEQDFALVLLDVSMPGMNGLETAKMIRQRPRSKSVPIMFITGSSSSSELILEAYAIGAYDFFIKPILPEVLRAKARLYLQLQERALQLQREAHTRSALRALAKLQEATAALSEARTPSDVAAVAVRLGAEACDATGGVLWTIRSDGALVLAGSHNLPGDFVARWSVIPAGAPVAASRVLRDRAPVWIETREDFARETPEPVGLARSFVMLPLVSQGHAIGLLSFTYDRLRTFSAEERLMSPAFARLCEQALERSRLYVVEAEARRAADELNSRKDEFLAMLGHELRNPLAAMVSGLELVKLGPYYTREIEILDRHVGHLTHLVGDLVDVGRISHGKITVRRESVNLAHAVADAIEGAGALLHRHELTIAIPQGLLVDADRQRFYQVVLNLLNNAAKYTPAPGRIELAATGDAEYVTLSVRDNGRGIAPGLLANLFEPFVQGERAPDRREGGLGIGLTLARMIVELHGGTITAHSGGHGQGATFVVRWPQAIVPSTSEPPRPLLPHEPGLRVLIVDDNDDAAEMLGAVVETFGHQVMVAHDSERGLAIAQQFAPHFALLDIGLPVIDGYELAGRLRAMPECAHTQLIAITGYGQPDDQERSRRAGFAHHLVKPVDLATLRALLVAPEE